MSTMLHRAPLGSGPYAEVADAIASYPDVFRDAVHTRFYRDQLESRALFTVRMEEAHLDLAPQISAVLERAHDCQLHDDDVEVLEALARQHRRHGFPSGVYSVFAEALKDGLRAVLWEAGIPYTVAAADSEVVLELICTTMAQASLEADYLGIPPASAGEVISVNRVSRRISVVTVDLGLPMLYRPGQHVLATATYTPGQWVRLAPAVPPTDFGQVEFHVHREPDSAYENLASAQVGDHWTFGQPVGASISDGPVTVIARGPGYGAARSVIFSRLTHPNPQRMDVYLQADYPGELYELAQLRTLAAASQWLNITAATVHPRDEWWVNPAVPVTDPDIVHLAGRNLRSIIAPDSPADRVEF